MLYLHPSQKDYADYGIKEVKVDGKCLDLPSTNSKEILIATEKLQNPIVNIEVLLDS
ncbi:hypothetical protein MNBD_BACTEROID05-1238 [hydrothermal vent metagenome]|uniref:Uncharacterized protein n=1 Tax=hydrothermal vent metagenome TaxID=652676 RepID=A0A3B0TCU2_9ZZZZ